MVVLCGWRFHSLLLLYRYWKIGANTNSPRQGRYWNCPSCTPKSCLHIQRRWPSEAMEAMNMWIFCVYQNVFFFFTYEIKYNKNAIGIEVVFQCSNFYHTLDKLFLHKVPNRQGYTIRRVKKSQVIGMVMMNVTIVHCVWWWHIAKKRQSPRFAWSSENVNKT